MSKAYISIFLLLITKQIYSQSDPEIIKPNKQSFYLEVFGNTYGLIGVNYERIFHVPKKSIFHFTARVGIGFAHRSVDTVGILNVPMECTFLLGRKTHYLETGLGWTASFGKAYTDNLSNPPVHYSSFGNVYLFRLGYRYTSRNGVLLRAAPLMQLVDNPTWKLEWSFGLSLGFSFSSFHS